MGGSDAGMPWAMSVPTADAPRPDSSAWVASARRGSPPPRMAELHGERPALRAQGARSSVASAGAPGASHGGELEQHGAEPPGLAQRFDRLGEAPPHLVQQALTRPPAPQRARVGSAQVRGQGRRARGMAGQQGERLDVEPEALRRTLHPQLAVAPARQRVVPGVHFDDGQPRGVVPQPPLGVPSPARIPAAPEELAVRPGTCSDQYVTHGSPGCPGLPVHPSVTRSPWACAKAAIASFTSVSGRSR